MIEIHGADLANCDIDMLLAAKMELDKEIKGRAGDELKQIEQRRQSLLAFIENEPIEAEPVKTRVPSVPKYRNPANPAETWSGRGKKPNWLSAFIAGGGAMEAVAI